MGELLRTVRCQGDADQEGEGVKVPRFASFVPREARTHIERTLFGSPDGWEGVVRFWEASQDEDLLCEVECLQRFASDARMIDVYNNVDASNIAQFLDCAWRAHLDFGDHRRRLNDAHKLGPKIAEAAERLAELIRAGMATGIPMPAEVVSVRAALGATEGRTVQWKLYRHMVVGGAQYAPPHSCHGVEPMLVPFDDSEQQFAWRSAPKMPALLDRVAESARDWTPKADAPIHGAIKRSANAVGEYLRALSALLGEAELPVTPKTEAAMTVVASVVLDCEVSETAARNALTR